MPVGLWVDVDLAARSNAIDSISDTRFGDPVGAWSVDAMGHDVQLERVALRIESSDRVAPTQRALAAAENQHHVLAWPMAEVGPRAGQFNASHVWADVANVRHAELQWLNAFNAEQSGRQRKREPSNCAGICVVVLHR